MTSNKDVGPGKNTKLITVGPTFIPDSKGGIISEKSEGFLHLQLSKKNTPKHYPKLLHPVHGNDKLLIKYNMFQVKKYYSYEM